MAWVLGQLSLYEASFLMCSAVVEGDFQCWKKKSLGLRLQTLDKKPAVQTWIVQFEGSGQGEAK